MSRLVTRIGEFLSAADRGPALSATGQPGVGYDG
jgi:hypothetical protein